MYINVRMCMHKNTQTRTQSPRLYVTAVSHYVSVISVDSQANCGEPSGQDTLRCNN